MPTREHEAAFEREHLLSEDELARFMSKVEKQALTGCWNWQAATLYGYGYFKWRGQQRRAHRIAYQHFIGEIPGEYVIDHLCSNRACVNPRHLEAVTQVVNIARGNTSKHNTSKTHCPRGHPYSGDNLYIRPGRNSRECFICKKQRKRSFDEKRRRNANV